MAKVFPPVPFSRSLRKSPSCQIESNALLKTTEALEVKFGSSGRSGSECRIVSDSVAGADVVRCSVFDFSLGCCGF